MLSKHLASGNVVSYDQLLYEGTGLRLTPSFNRLYATLAKVFDVSKPGSSVFFKDLDAVRTFNASLCAVLVQTYGTQDSELKKALEGLQVQSQQLKKNEGSTLKDHAFAEREAIWGQQLLQTATILIVANQLHKTQDVSAIKDAVLKAKEPVKDIKNLDGIFGFLTTQVTQSMAQAAQQKKKETSVEEIVLDPGTPDAPLAPEAPCAPDAPDAPSDPPLAPSAPTAPAFEGGVEESKQPQKAVSFNELAFRNQYKEKNPNATMKEINDAVRAEKEALKKQQNAEKPLFDVKAYFPKPILHTLPQPSELSSLSSCLVYLQKSEFEDADENARHSRFLGTLGAQAPSVQSALIAWSVLSVDNLATLLQGASKVNAPLSSFLGVFLRVDSSPEIFLKRLTQVFEVCLRVETPKQVVAKVLKAFSDNVFTPLYANEPKNDTLLVFQKQLKQTFTKELLSFESVLSDFSWKDSKPLATFLGIKMEEKSKQADSSGFVVSDSKEFQKEYAPMLRSVDLMVKQTYGPELEAFRLADKLRADYKTLVGVESKEDVLVPSSFKEFELKAKMLEGFEENLRLFSRLEAKAKAHRFEKAAAKLPKGDLLEKQKEQLKTEIEEQDLFAEDSVAFYAEVDGFKKRAVLSKITVKMFPSDSKLQTDFVVLNKVMLIETFVNGFYESSGKPFPDMFVTNELARSMMATVFQLKESKEPQTLSDSVWEPVVTRVNGVMADSRVSVDIKQSLIQLFCFSENPLTLCFENLNESHALDLVLSDPKAAALITGSKVFEKQRDSFDATRFSHAMRQRTVTDMQGQPAFKELDFLQKVTTLLKSKYDFLPHLSFIPVKTSEHKMEDQLTQVVLSNMAGYYRPVTLAQCLDFLSMTLVPLKSDKNSEQKSTEVDPNLSAALKLLQETFKTYLFTCLANSKHAVTRIVLGNETLSADQYKFFFNLMASSLHEYPYDAVHLSIMADHKLVTAVKRSKHLDTKVKKEILGE